MDNLNVTISIDDVNPKKGWRILGDITEQYLLSLNREFGAKFTLFIPSNHHKDSPISQNEQWARELRSTGIFELAAHGHYHQTTNKNEYGEMEFAHMTEDECRDRLILMMHEWADVGITPRGWRNPGWICQPYCVPLISRLFDWVALHEVHNGNLKWDCKMLFGAIGIDQTNINYYNDDIMFQSHIFGDWNKNTWNDTNYEQMRMSLNWLVKNHNIQFKTISEL